VGALLADLRLGHAELVDPAPHDRDGAVEILGRELVALRRHRLEDDLEAALQVEAERRFLVRRRSRHGQKRDADEGREDESGQNEVAAPVAHAEGRVASSSSAWSPASSSCVCSVRTAATARFATRTTTWDA